jgi:phosphohistidine phosphatase SixA
MSFMLLRHGAPVAAVVLLCLGFLPARGETLEGSALVARLRQGGYVLAMRHASSPLAPPDKSAADPENTKLERQLDEVGRRTAEAMGAAIKTLRIPIGTVDCSPTYRAEKTVELAGLGTPQLVPELGEGEQGMADKNADRAAWLKKAVAIAPKHGTNTILMTHTPNLNAAFRQDAAGVAAGEALVFYPDGKGGAALVGRIKIETWPELAARP